MKKAFLGVLLLTSALAMKAQLVTVGEISRVNLPAGVAVEQAVISPDGLNVAFTDLKSRGLSLMPVNSAVAKRISDSGVALDLAFTPDSRTVVFDEVSYDRAHRRSVSVKAFDIATGRKKEVHAATRDLNGVSVDNSGINVVAKGRVASKKLNAAAAARPVLSIDRGQLCITENGNTRVLSPLGTAGMSYLWPSLSPDGKRICFYVASMGCYTCKIDGSDVKKIGWLRAARWLDNNIVVGMRDRTDGNTTTASAIIASNIDGSVKQTLTPERYIAVLPSVATDKIAFSTADGELYIININK